MGSGIQSSPMVHTPTPPMVHTPTPPPASKESEAEPMPKEEGERDEGNEAKDKTEAEEEEEEEEDDDTDLDTDEEIMTLNVKAVFDYTARNEKELSFNQGDMLHVIEKTPDNNWWDGMFQGKRGFIPVAYVEIVHPSGSMTSLTSPVPAPPARLSSLAAIELPEDPTHKKATEEAEDVKGAVERYSVSEHTEEVVACHASPKEMPIEEVIPVTVRSTYKHCDDSRGAKNDT